MNLLASRLSIFAALRWISFLASLLLVPLQLSAICYQPLPRLVCAEYFHSRAVVVARLAGLTRIKDSWGDVTGTYYSMTVERTLRGEVPRLFRIYEPNDHGRADFIWDIDESYLLFLREQTPNEGWLIDSCGNSGPLELRGKTLKQVEAIDSASAQAIVQGAVGHGSLLFPLAGVQIEVRARDSVKTTLTNRDGTFEVQVAPGKYEVQALSPGKTLVADDRSYDDPGNLTLLPGGCAQVQFVESGQSR